ncbi:MAG: porin [Muribaculaceae bacterium]|nr:porin [Muribaculaceae bacterium]
MRFTRTLPVWAILAATLTASAQEQPATACENEEEMGQLPETAIVLNGDRRQVHSQVLNVLLDTRDLSFQDPDVPRYLIIDKEGKSLLGIGGYIEGVAMGDFRGDINNRGFMTYDIPVPGSPTARSRMAADVSHSTIFLKLVRHTRVGALTAYFQTNFTGDNGGYGLALDQAYVSVGNITMGLANSTFADVSANAPVIDYKGPSGQVGCKNVLLRYRIDLDRHWAMAISAESAKTTVTAFDGQEEMLNQSWPDIPLYVQYSWGTGSHVRASGMIRNLGYRDLIDGHNCHHMGYGLQLSGIFDIQNKVSIFYQGAYGRGIAHYINDLDGNGFDLVGSTTDPGKMIAPRTVSFAGGARYNFTSKLFASAAYSFNRLYDQSQLGGDTYLRGNYVSANLFYSPVRDLQIGAEYLHGTRKNVNLESNCANRINLMIKYSF